MSSWLSENKKPLTYASLTFGLLFALVLYLSFFYDFRYSNLSGLLFLMSFVCCVLVAKSIFDNTKAAAMSAAYEQQAMVEQTIQSEDLYVQLYKNSPVPYFILDSGGFVKSANVAGVRMLGMNQSQVRGLDIFSKLHAPEPEHLEFALEKYRSGVPISDEMVRVNRTDHKETWALLSLFGVVNVAGEHIGLLTLVDISKQKKAEDAKSEFVSLASHQLRTPIAGIKWSAELLKLDEPERLSVRQNKYIDRLLESIHRMAILVDDFLRVSRFELGTFQPEYSEVPLPHFITEVLEEQQPRVQQREATIVTDFDPSIQALVTDKNLLRMIVTNLFSNAVKYSKQGGVVQVEYQLRDDEFVLRVIDSGIGIPIADQDVIFAKLFRASNAVRDVPDGTGLGLYIVQQAVAVLKGKVTFTSAENVGTTFEVVLPLDAVALNRARAD